MRDGNDMYINGRDNDADVDSYDASDDDYIDAAQEDVDFVIALYREDGLAVANRLSWELANDLDDLIDALRRLPGDVGATGFVCIDNDFFVICRVRGAKVNVFLSDPAAAHDWPLARDVVDFLGEDCEDIDDEDVIGDSTILADQGIDDFDLETIATNLDADASDLVRQIAVKLRFTREFDAAVR